MRSKHAETEEQERQAKDRHDGASVNHKRGSPLHYGVYLSPGQAGNEVGGFVFPLANKIAIVHILGAAIFLAGAADIVFMVRQDALLDETIPSRRDWTVRGKSRVGSKRRIGGRRSGNRSCYIGIRRAWLRPFNGRVQTQPSIPLQHSVDVNTHRSIFWGIPAF